MKCPICNEGTLNKEKIREEQFGVGLGVYDGLLCNSCGESFFDSKTTHRILAKSKEKGIFGLHAKTKIARSGNSLAIRIPKKIVEFMKLKEGKEVSIHPEKGKIVIEE